MKNRDRLELNKKGWNQIADKWFGSTSLPTYAPHMKTEKELNLFGNIENKKVLDIGCGSGHSLKYMGDNNASELWGLDISSSQLKNAKEFLAENSYSAKLFESPMEINPGIPENYFDIVYSIYAFGWTVDLDKSIQLVSKYLKPNGIFIMSWDHPILSCTTVQDKKLIIDKSYHDLKLMSMSKANEEMSFTKWKMSSYINAFSKSNMYMEELIEDIPEEIKTEEHDDFTRYYSKHKAQLIPLSMIVKARKK